MKKMISYITVNDLNDPALAVYSGLKEVQLKHYYEPAEGLFICESPKVIRRALSAGFLPESFLFDPRHLKGDGLDLLEQCPDIPLFMAPSEIMIRLTGFHLTGGMLCAMKRKPLPDPAELCQNARRVAVLEDIENPTNIGAIFRSAAALGMDAVLLTEGCSDPLYRRAARVSVGTVFQIPWTFLGRKEENTAACLHRLGFQTASFALSDQSLSIDDPRLKKAEKLAVLLGNEEKGLHPETLKASDYIVRIPMAEGVDSLNVAAASAVAFWELQK